MKNKIAVVGFQKCGQVSLVKYLRKLYPKAEVLRPEIIYEDSIDFTGRFNLRDYSIVVIIRNPIDRIQSGVRYWANIRKLYETHGIEKVLKGTGPFGFKIGWQDPIGQSDYQKYIEKFEEKYDVNIEKVFKFDELINDSDFPHENKSWNRITFSKSERILIEARITEMMMNAY